MADNARIGFIGAGWWATSLQMPYFASRSDVTLVGVCRPGAAELALVKQRFGFAHATEDVQELVSLDLDGVVVATPHVLHFAHARAALLAGRHVLVEKPMVTSAADAHELVRLSAAAGRQVMVPQGWSFTSYAAEAARLVHSGAIGEVRHAVVQMASSLGDLFAGAPLAGTEQQLFQPAASTWADPARAGGYGWGQLSHALGLLFQIAPIAPQQVFALMGTSATGADYYDAISVRLTNGGTAAISGSATIPKNTSAKGFQLDIRLFGTAGMLLLDIERERCEVHRDDGTLTVVPIQPGDGGYPPEGALDRFVALCKGEDVANPAPASVGAAVVQVLAAAYASARSSKLEDVQ